MEKMNFVVQVYIRREGVAYASVAVEAESAEAAEARVQRLIDDGDTRVWDVINGRLASEGYDDEAIAEDAEATSSKRHAPDLDLTIGEEGEDEAA